MKGVGAAPAGAGLATTGVLEDAESVVSGFLFSGAFVDFEGVPEGVWVADAPPTGTILTF